MNSIQEISSHCQALPEELQNQVLDFIYFLEARHAGKQSSATGSPSAAAELEPAKTLGASPEREKRKPVILGVMADAFTIPDDFDRPLPEHIVDEFYSGKL